MKTLKMRHINAVTRAQNLLETAIDVDGNKKLRKSIEKDIAILCELRDILFFAHENPSLPFPDEPLLNPISEEPNAVI